MLSPTAALFFLDYHGSRETRFPYPLTINNLMWMVFFLGLAEAWIRYSASRVALRHLELDYVGIEHGATLRIEQLPDVMKRLEGLRSTQGDGFLPRLLESVLRSLKTSGSVGSALGVLNTNVDLYFHVVESRYTTLNYLVWLIPTLGFIGTVVGVAFALEYAGQPNQLINPKLLEVLASELGTAFYTTFVALLQAAVLVAFKSYLANRDEIALNKSAQYCVERVLNDIDVRV